MFLEERTFVNEGSLTLGAESGNLEMRNGAVFENHGTVDDNAGFVSGGEGGTAPRFVNYGAFDRTEHTVQPGEVKVSFINHGSVSVETGILGFLNPTVEPSSSWSATFEKGDIVFTGGTLTFKESNLLAGDISIIGATVTAEHTKTSHVPLGVGEGTLNVASGTTLAVDRLALEANFRTSPLFATITGAGTLTVKESFRWTEGSMKGSGSTVLQPGSSSVLVKGAELLERTLVNEGTATIEAEQGSMSITKGAKLVNAGTFVDNSLSGVSDESEGAGSSARIVNNGVFQKTVGSETTPVQVPFENLGAIKELTGHIHIFYPIAATPTTSVYGGPGNPSAPGHPCPVCGEPVVAATGDLVETQTDLSVGGRGVGLGLTRTYNSQAGAEGTKGIFGYGWSSTFSDHLALEKESSKVTLHQADGSTVPFTESGGSLIAPAWSPDKLSGSSESGYTLTLANQTQYNFSGSSGRLESVTDRNGNETTLSYGETGRLGTITDPTGRKLTLAYNGEGLVESAKDPMGHTVKYTYEGGNLATVTLPGEEKARGQFRYDGSHELTEMTDGRGGKTINEYNSSHQVISQTDPAKRTLTFEYEGFFTKITNSTTGAVTAEQFTSNDEPFAITRGYHTAVTTTRSFTYNEASYVTSETDGDGHTTKYGYDSEDNRTSMVDPDEHETKWEYNATHDVISVTTPKGEKTTIKRDSHGNIETIERPAPGGKTQITKYKYTVHGELESVTNPLEHTSKYEYDAKGDRTAEIDPENNKRTWEYNEDSQETATVNPRGNVKGAEASKFTTKFERDMQGRPVKITDPLGHTTEYKYDGDGNIESVTDANKHTTSYTYDADNEPIKIKQANGAVTETEYDGAGQIIAQIDANKHQTKYKRNVVEQVTEATDPLGHSTTKEYDGAGNLVKLTDPAKRTTTYSYDPANRLTEVSYSSGKPATVKYEYDKDGDRTKMTDGTGTTTYTYDELDRLTQSENGHKEVVKYDYDLANNQTKITYPNGKAVTHAYDKDGRLEKITDWLEHVTKFTYDGDSNLKVTAFPSETKDEDKYAYNDADQATEVKMVKSSETLASLVYTRDSDGQVKKTTAKKLPGAEVTEATYDENNRITKYGTTEYKYDPANNPTTEGASTNTFNEDDELEKGGGISYTYDELGERTKATPEKGSATTYGYDQAGNLTTVERPKEGETAKIEDGYTYNGEDLRTIQTISGTTDYIAWDMAEELPLILTDGTNSYIYGPGGAPIEQINNTTSTVLYLHHDQQGSTRLITGSTGKVEGKCTYGAYGAPTCEGTATTSLGYDGQYTNTDTGLIYLRARSYDPSTAQFMSHDPFRALTHAPYTYAADNPSNVADPAGLFSFGEVTGAIGEAAHAVGEGVKVAGEFVVEHPVIISAVGCTVGALAGPEVCAGAIAASYGLGTADNINEYIEGNINAEQLFTKQLLTASISALGAVPGLPLLSPATADLLGQSSTAIQLLVNGYLEAPDVAFNLLEPQISCALGLR